MRVYFDGELSASFLTSGCPIDDKNCLVLTLTKQPPQQSRAIDVISLALMKLQVWVAKLTDVGIWNQIDVEAIAVHVREDRATLQYLKLYDRFVSRVDLAWAAARSGEGARGADVRAGQILRSSRRAGAAVNESVEGKNATQ
jgi:hypothetical protein